MKPAKVLALMYHYVEGPYAPLRRKYPCVSESTFRAHLERLCALGRPMSPRELADALEQNDWPAEVNVVLTFDDGTRDHADVVVPMLREFGYEGLFFVLGQPLSGGPVPATHALHILASHENLPHDRLWQALVGHVGAERIADVDAADRVYHYERDPLMRRVKYVVNYCLSPDEADDVGHALLAAFTDADSGWVDRWFACAGQLRVMSGQGAELATHGHRHIAACQFDDEAWSADLRRCHDAVAALGPPPRFYCWPLTPFPDRHQQDPRYAARRDLLGALGYVAAFTAAGQWTSDDDPFWFARIDAGQDGGLALLRMMQNER